MARLEDMASGWREDSGAAEDGSAAQNPGPGQPSPDGSIHEENPEAAQKLVANYLWDAIKGQDDRLWLGAAGGTQLREQIMSLVTSLGMNWYNRAVRLVER